MTTSYTWDVFMTLDGFGATSGDWTGYWGKQGPELLEHRLELFRDQQRMVFGATTFREFVDLLAGRTEDAGHGDQWVGRMKATPATVVSSTLEAPVDWPDATIVGGDGVEVVRRLKDESTVPLRSHGSASLNRALMAAGLVDRLQVSVFPAVTARTGIAPLFTGGQDYDLELLEQRTFDGRVQELTYRPTLH